MLVKKFYRLHLCIFILFLLSSPFYCHYLAYYSHALMPLSLVIVCFLNIITCIYYGLSSTPSQFIYWSLTSNMTEFGDGDIGKRYVTRRKPTWMGLALIRDSRAPPSSLCYMRTQDGDGHLWTKKEVLTRHQISLHLDLPSLQNCQK